MALVLAMFLLAQNYSQRGFVELRTTFYPEAAPRDSSHASGEALARYEGVYRPFADLQIAGGVDGRTDTHRYTVRDFDLDWKDRGRRRPAVSVRRLSAQYHRKGLSIEAGKQYVRWGKTDIVNPTDRFAPRDYLTVVDNDFLGVLAARALLETGAHTFDAIWAPRLTPNRVPLTDDRWSAIPEGVVVPPVERDIPGGPQFGFRWNYTGYVEFSAAYYSGYDPNPSFEPQPARFAVREFYPKMRMAGGDFAVPLPWMTLKSEAAYFTSPDERAEDYVIYVVQLERQAGEWSFVGGYGGEAVTSRSGTGNFNPSRGLLRTVLARAGYTIDVNRSIGIESAIRENGDGLWIKGEYSQAFGQHWRLTAAGTLIRGETSDFLGQYRGNSHGSVAVKYSF